MQYCTRECFICVLTTKRFIVMVVVVVFSQDVFVSFAGKHFTCNPPPRVENAIVNHPYDNAFNEEDQVEYVCRKGYELVGESFSKCYIRNWSRQPTCGKVTRPSFTSEIRHVHSPAFIYTERIG